MVVLAILLHGVAWGMRGPLMMALRADYFGLRQLGKIAGWSNADYFGLRQLGKIAGWSNTITAGGSIIGPVYAGNMANAQGDYTFAFFSLGAVVIVGSLTFFLARRPPLPARARAAQAG